MIRRLLVVVTFAAGCFKPVDDVDGGLSTVIDPGRDAGVLDAGREDAGLVPDAGQLDAGPVDAGTIDASVSDSDGAFDAGQSADAGRFDAGPSFDSGVDDRVTDGGAGVDAGGADAGARDAGSDAGSLSCWPRPSMPFREVRRRSENVWGDLFGLQTIWRFWETEGGAVLTEAETLTDGGGVFQRTGDFLVVEVDGGPARRILPSYLIGGGCFVRRSWGFRGLAFASTPNLEDMVALDVPLEGPAPSGAGPRFLFSYPSPSLSFSLPSLPRSSDGLTWWSHLGKDSNHVIWWRPEQDQAGFVPIRAPLAVSSGDGSQVNVVSVSLDGGTQLSTFTFDGGFAIRAAYPFAAWQCAFGQRDWWCSGPASTLYRVRADGGMSALSYGRSWALKHVNDARGIVVAIASNSWNADGGMAVYLLRDDWEQPHLVFEHSRFETIVIGPRSDGGLAFGYWDQRGVPISNLDLPPLVFGDVCPP